MRPGGATIRQRCGDLVTCLAIAACAWSAISLLTGGFVLHAGALTIATRSAIRPLLAGLVLAALARVLLGAGGFASWIAWLAGAPGQRAARAAVLAATGAFIVALAWNTRAVGGSDSSCYVLQADAFAHGRVTLAPVLTDVPAGLTPAAQAPTGFIPSPRPPHAAVPICAPGLAVVMAPFLIAHRDLVFLIVPLFAAMAVWFTFALGRALDDEVAGVCAALLVAASPIFLYQAVQPMSDVPAAALWLAALVFCVRGPRVRPVLAGVCASMAVFARPNLAVLAILLPVLLLKQRGSGDVAGSATGRLQPLFRFAAGAAPAAFAMLAINAARYGSPLASGYGSTDVLFAWAHVAPNLARYPRWLLETHTPFVLLAAAGPWVLWRRGRGVEAAIATASVVVTFATYFAYTVFDDWWYLRFVLPALPVVLLLATLTLRAAAGRAIAVTVSLLLAGWFVHVAEQRQVFGLAALESRFVQAGEYAASLPAAAVALSVQQSASVRFYGGRATAAWDGVDPAALDSVLAWLTARGRPPFIVLEDVEEPRFRERFAGQAFGALDWPPFADVHASGRVRFYDPAQRAGYLSGVRYKTEIVTAQGGRGGVPVR